MTGGAAVTTAALLVFSLLLATLYASMDRGLFWAQRLVPKAGSVLLVALAVALEQGSPVLVLALVLSAIGDGALVFPGRPAFLAGLVAFLLAHLAFALCMILAPGWHAQPVLLWQWALIILPVGGAVALLAAVWDGARGMRAPATAYAAVILFMVTCAVLSARLPMIAGALLFFASDAVLALETFRIGKDAPVRRFTKPFVWWSYYAAQLLLAYALLDG